MARFCRQRGPCGQLLLPSLPDTHTSIQAGPAPGGWGKGSVPCPVVDKAMPPSGPSSVPLPLAVLVAAAMKVTSGPAFGLCSLMLLLLLQVPGSLGLASQPRGKRTVMGTLQL